MGNIHKLTIFCSFFFLAIIKTIHFSFKRFFFQYFTLMTTKSVLAMHDTSIVSFVSVEMKVLN